MLKTLKIRTLVLSTHGALMLLLGLAFLYLRANMTNILFDVLDVGIAILLAVGVFLIAALVDWVAAIGEGIEHFRRFAFYLLGGIALALSGLLLIRFPTATVALLLLFTAAHALIYSISILAFHRGPYRHAAQLASVSHSPIPNKPFLTKPSLHKPRLGAAANYLIGTISLLFALAMATLATRDNDLAAMAILGAYLCFLGARTLLAAWNLHRTTIYELHKAAHAAPSNA